MPKEKEIMLRVVKRPSVNKRNQICIGVLPSEGERLHSNATLLYQLPPTPKTKSSLVWLRDGELCLSTIFDWEAFIGAGGFLILRAYSQQERGSD